MTDTKEMTDIYKLSDKDLTDYIKSVLRDSLKSTRKESGFANAKDLCDKLCISYSTYHNYESGARIPTLDVLLRLADFYNASIDSMLCRSEYLVSSLSSQEKALIDLFRQIPEKGRSEILQFLTSTVEFLDKVKDDPNFKKHYWYDII